jgi:alkylresorcinol/alkylpyrone synthase
MAVISSVVTALPDNIYSRDDILAVSAQWLSEFPHQRELFDRFVSSAQISQRHFAIPLEDILRLSGAQERAQLFQTKGRALMNECVGKLFAEQRVKAQEIDHLLFTSCSSPAIPSIDVGVIDDHEFRRSVNRVPIFQHGCAGGIIGLSLAHRLLREGQKALLSSVEICSLVYQAADVSGGNLVGSAIFGDGAAAVLIEDTGEGLCYIDAQSHLIPESAHLMGYNIEDDGTHLRLDRALPQALTQYTPPFVKSFLAQNNTTTADIDWWLFHPGGVKVLHALEEAFAIRRTQSHWAWDVLEQYGNMSSASILFVLKEFLQAKSALPGQKVCMLGVGPGLTIEAILLEQT